MFLLPYINIMIADWLIQFQLCLLKLVKLAKMAQIPITPEK